MRFAALLIAAGLLLGAPVACADDLQDCRTDGERAFAACSSIIADKAAPTERLAQAYSVRAMLQQGRGDIDAMIADLDQAIRLMQEAGKSGWQVAFMYFVRGGAHRAKGDLERAIADHTESIRIAPGWDKSYNERGSIYFHKGDLANALADISQVIALRPSSPRVAEAYAIRAMLHRQLGQPAEALPDADKAIALDAQSALAHFVRGQILEMLGRPDEAAASRQAALALDAGIAQRLEAMEGRPEKP
jgi:tetratricopeptide (TPR) repeat protein